MHLLQFVTVLSECEYVCVWVSVCQCVCVCVCVSVWEWVCEWVCVCVKVILAGQFKFPENRQLISVHLLGIRERGVWKGSCCQMIVQSSASAGSMLVKVCVVGDSDTPLMCCGVHSSMGPILMGERRKESNMVSNSHLMHTHSHFTHTHTHTLTHTLTLTHITLTHTHTHTHTHTRTHSHSHTLTHTHTHSHTHSHTLTHTHTHTHWHTLTHTHTSLLSLTLHCLWQITKAAKEMHYQLTCDVERTCWSSKQD